MALTYPDFPVTKESLIEEFLFGVRLNDGLGHPFPESMWIRAIRSAIASMSRRLDLELMPVEFYGDDRTDTEQDAQGRFGAERHYYNPADSFCSIKLRRGPLRGSPTEVRLVYPGNSTPVFTFPSTWIRVSHPKSRRINLVPAVGSLPSLATFPLGGSWTSTFVHTGGVGPFPDLMRVDYKAGFEQDKVPDDIIQLVSLQASMNILNPAGDLIAGAGIASSSLSIGGLSQSINTTSSATNAGYGARLIRYDKEIKDLLPAVRAAYHGMELDVV